MRYCVKSKEEKEEDKRREGGMVRKRNEKGEWEIRVGCACKVSFYVCLVRSNHHLYSTRFPSLFLSFLTFSVKVIQIFLPKGAGEMAQD